MPMPKPVLTEEDILAGRNIEIALLGDIVRRRSETPPASGKACAQTR